MKGARAGSPGTSGRSRRTADTKRVHPAPNSVASAATSGISGLPNQRNISTLHVDDGRLRVTRHLTTLLSGAEMVADIGQCPSQGLLRSCRTFDLRDCSCIQARYRPDAYGA